MVTPTRTTEAKQRLKSPGDYYSRLLIGYSFKVIRLQMRQQAFAVCVAPL